MNELRTYMNLIESVSNDADYTAKQEYVYDCLGWYFSDPGFYDMKDNIQDRNFFIEAFDALQNKCGEYIDHGMYRVVFSHRDDPSLVIKINGGDEGPYCNRNEIEIWNAVKHDGELSRWFSPIVSASDNCWVIEQKKTQNLRSGDFPKQIPSFFKHCDMEKLEQWGYDSNGNMLCHDYGDMDRNKISEGWTMCNVRINEQNKNEFEFLN